MGIENNWMTRLLLGEREATSWTIYVSSVENAEVLKLATRDDAECRGVGASSSNVIEDLIIAAELPTEERARRYAVEMYLRDAAAEPKSKISSRYDKGSGILHGLSMLCADLAAGTNWEAAYPATRPILDYINEYVLNHAPTVTITGKESDAEYVADRFRRVVELVGKATDEQLGDCGGAWYTGDGEPMAREISLGNYAACNPTGYICQYEPVVGNSTHTFRFLHALLSNLQPVKDTAVERRRFVEAVTQFCEDWADYDRIMAERRKRPATTALFDVYEMADGDIVEIPKRYTVVNPSDAPRSTHVVTVTVHCLHSCNYGEVIHEASGLREPIPNFACFTDKPREIMSSDDLAALKRKVADAYPPFSEVIEDEPEIEDLIWVYSAKENEGWSGDACIIHRTGDREKA